ncbi:hypothetical protein GCM10022233_87750 [Streptomyces shaanxiensis]|uniref:Uncharacterized protein n=1 Tax=Streptomyces shaanxiensis TaxID=653357 RepID=A0ABP7WLE4_9ACTN
MLREWWDGRFRGVASRATMVTGFVAVGAVAGCGRCQRGGLGQWLSGRLCSDVVVGVQSRALDAVVIPGYGGSVICQKAVRRELLLRPWRPGDTVSRPARTVRTGWTGDD